MPSNTNSYSQSNDSAACSGGTVTVRLGDEENNQVPFEG